MAKIILPLCEGCGRAFQEDDKLIMIRKAVVRPTIHRVYDRATLSMVDHVELRPHIQGGLLGRGGQQVWHDTCFYAG